jgi:hypothetical protein
MKCRKSEASFKAIANVLVKTFVLPSPVIEHQALAENVMNVKVPTF